VIKLEGGHTAACVYSCIPSTWTLSGASAHLAWSLRGSCGALASFKSDLTHGIDSWWLAFEEGEALRQASASSLEIHGNRTRL
jgi:hypothetical protein